MSLGVAPTAREKIEGRSERTGLTRTGPVANLTVVLLAAGSSR